AAIVTLVAGVAAGLGPALLETRRLHGNPMRTIASDRVRQRWRHALVLAEIAVTCALLVVSGGMIDSYRRNFAPDVGYPPHPLVLMRIDNAAGLRATRIVDTLERIPGVASAAASTSIPFLAFGPLRKVSIDATESRSQRAELVSIGRGFFDTLGVPLRG